MVSVLLPASATVPTIHNRIQYVHTIIPSRFVHNSYPYFFTSNFTRIDTDRYFNGNKIFSADRFSLRANLHIFLFPGKPWPYEQHCEDPEPGLPPGIIWQVGRRGKIHAHPRGGGHCAHNRPIYIDKPGIFIFFTWSTLDCSRPSCTVLRSIYKALEHFVLKFHQGSRLFPEAGRIGCRAAEGIFRERVEEILHESPGSQPGSCSYKFFFQPDTCGRWGG